jgi:hypothetical protein
MKHPSTSSRILAGIAGTGCVTGSLMILLGDQLWKPATWQDHHWLTILMVGGTIAVGKLTHKAWPSRKLSSFGFAVMFFVGTLLTVYNSVGRQAETTDAKQLTAEQTNTAIAAKSSELAEATKRLVKAHKKVELQINGGIDEDTGEKVKKGCFDVCDGWKQQRRDITVVVKTLEIELAALGPKKPVNAKAEKFAEIAALFSFDKAKATAAFALLEPFLFTLFFEFGSIIALGFAFTGSVAPVSVVANDTGPGLPQFPQFPEHFPGPAIVQFPTKHKVIKALESQRGPVSNSKLAELLGETEGEASKSWREVQDRLEIGRQGKELRIQLRRTA